MLRKQNLRKLRPTTCNRKHATPGIAAAFVAVYESGTRRLLQFPKLGTPMSRVLRVLPMRHFLYSIIYLAAAEAITIRAGAHQRRRPGYSGGRRCG